MFLKVYHKLDFKKFYNRHKILVYVAVFLSLFFVYLAPLLPYVPQSLVIITDFVVAKDNLDRDASRTNILILGLDGRMDGPSSNTDTIIFASLDRSGKQNLMLSVPRDLWIEDLQTKVNDAYSSGNRTEGNGLETSRTAVSSVVGQPIHYVLTISFDGFIKIIDALGGVDVLVDRAFTDSKYPITGKENDTCAGDPLTLCRWETLSFTQGVNRLDGVTALKFSRSRHSESGEGTDFARSNRQQKVIVAVKQKLFSLEFFLNPLKVREVIEIIHGSIDTDIPFSKYSSFAKLALKAKDGQIRSEVFPWDPKGSPKDSPNYSILYHPPISLLYKNEWVLLPVGDTFEPIHNWVKCLLESGVCSPEGYVNKTLDE